MINAYQFTKIFDKRLHFRDKPNIESKQNSITKELYEKYYANKPHEKARSTTPKNLPKAEEKIEPRILVEGSDRKPKRQEHTKVHPSRYNLPIGIKLTLYIHRFSYYSFYDCKKLLNMELHILLFNINR